MDITLERLNTQKLDILYHFLVITLVTPSRTKVVNSLIEVFVFMIFRILFDLLIFARSLFDLLISA